jgi:hypothetical protein
LTDAIEFHKQHSGRTWWAPALFIGVSLFYALAATAAPNDIRVLTDDISAPGTTNGEFQASLARPPATPPLGSGLVFQGLVELAYGIADHWEISAQLPVAKVHGGWYANGINTELQYIAPHDDDDGYYWGARAELGYASPVDEARAWHVELRPILGYRFSDWHFVLNPAVSMALNGEDRKVKFEPSAKASYQVTRQSAVGAEYFAEVGSLSNFLPRSQRSELAFLVLDSKIGKSGVSFGLGRRMTDGSDRWVAKLITSFPLD